MNKAAKATFVALSLCFAVNVGIAQDSWVSNTEARVNLELKSHEMQEGIRGGEIAMDLLAIKSMTKVIYLELMNGSGAEDALSRGYAEALRLHPAKEHELAEFKSKLEVEFKN